MSGLFYRAAGAILAPFRYAEREVKHLTEVAKEDIQARLANAVKFGALALVGLFFLFFISVTAAAAINQATDSAWIGFGIVSVFYLLVGVGLYLWKLAADKKKIEEKQILESNHRSPKIQTTDRPHAPRTRKAMEA